MKLMKHAAFLEHLGLPHVFSLQELKSQASFISSVYVIITVDFNND